MEESEIGPVEGDNPASASIRRQAWAVAGILLLGLGALLLVTGLVGLVTGGGVAFLLLAVPPAGVGLLVRRRLAAIRSSAMSVSLAYGAFAVYVATTPLRGLAPSDGTGSPGPDLALVLIGAAFGAAALLLLVGDPEG